MSGFDLVPVDGGGPIHLPPGETVLGRGPLLGVSDKRVSRSHGLLENLDGRLRLKPTHLNPCFVQSSLTDEPRPLQRDSWFPLRHGDLFSLLPGQFLYQVVSVGGATVRNSQTLEEEEEEELPVSPKPDVEPPPPPPPPLPSSPPPPPPPTAAALWKQEEDESSLKQKDAAPPEQVDERRDASERRRRVLPAWMTAAVAAPRPSSSGLKVQAAVKRSNGPSAPPTGTKRAARQASPEEAELSGQDMPKKRRKKMSDEDQVTEQDVPSQQLTVRLQSDESDSFTVEVDDGGAEASTADEDAASQTSLSHPEGEDGRTKDGGQVNKRVDGGCRPRRRTACPYGKDCYRKNPVHFQECSHPGDTDYEEEEEEEEEELPECPYGSDCYRKNPLHRKEYRHPTTPASTKRTVRKKPPADEEEDEEEDDDSFINDDSEDAGDDSDYVPPDSDDSGKEDILRLQREAKAFLKKRK